MKTDLNSNNSNKCTSQTNKIYLCMYVCINTLCVAKRCVCVSVSRLECGIFHFIKISYVQNAIYSFVRSFACKHTSYRSFHSIFSFRILYLIIIMIVLHHRIHSMLEFISYGYSFFLKWNFQIKSNSFEPRVIIIANGQKEKCIICIAYIEQNAIYVFGTRTASHINKI